MSSAPERIRQTLQSFGFDEPESMLYIALLELGSQPASVLAKQANLKRGHTYNILTRLMEKGIVQEHEKDGVKYFTGCAPASLISMLERRAEDLERTKAVLLDTLPLLQQLSHPLVLPPKVRLFQGVESMKEIYNDSLRHAEGVIHAFGDFAHFFPKERSRELNEWIWRYCERRAEKGIWYEGIVNKSADSDFAFKKRREHKRRLKMLVGIDLPVEVNVYGNRVAIMSSSRDLVGLIIEDQPIADTLRNLHHAFWKMLPEYRP
ncbi:MAG TPA: helix-turn-helix domain-containing protein [Candidatus Peribacterales bacterium]|nr:helix-turn-helix domain-containing protein [Candidatus Peribacterales bacterium]